MLYFSQMLGLPVLDTEGEQVGEVNDLGIATKEVFPRVTSLAFKGDGKTPFMVSWRKYVDHIDADAVYLKVPAEEIRFSYLQPTEVLISRDLLNKQIVDTRGLRVVRVNDVKLSDSGTDQLRLLGAEVGMRGLLRSLSPTLERVCVRVSRAFGHEIPERLIAWSYMDLLDRDLKDVKLSVSHKTLGEMHPADIADIIEQLDPRLRAQVFAQLDDTQAADALSEIDDDELAASMIDEMPTSDATRLLRNMDPDDAADLVSELDYDRAEQLLHLMGVNEENAVRQLLGYKEDTAGRIMTAEYIRLHPQASIQDAVDAVRETTKRDVETTNYIYVVDEEQKLQGVVSLKSVVIEPLDVKLQDIMMRDLITCDPTDDQENVAEAISKYNLLALPVVEEDGTMLGIVTVDDALDVMEEEHEEDLHLAGAHEDTGKHAHVSMGWMFRAQLWYFFWAVGAVVLVALLHAMGFGAVMIAAAVALLIALPMALLMADTMVDYVANFALEYDQNDKDAPSLSSFFWRGIGVSSVMLIFMLLIAAAVLSMISPDQGSVGLLIFAFIAAAISSFISFLSAPIYLTVVRKRDEKGEDTRKTSLRLVALLIAMLTYTITLVIIMVVLGQFIA